MNFIPYNNQTSFCNPDRYLLIFRNPDRYLFKGSWSTINRSDLGAFFDLSAFLTKRNFFRKCLSKLHGPIFSQHLILAINKSFRSLFLKKKLLEKQIARRVYWHLKGFSFYFIGSVFPFQPIDINESSEDQNGVVSLLNTSQNPWHS